MNYLLSHIIQTRLIFFISTLLIMGLIETVIPRRKLTTNKVKRWLNNLSLITLNTILVRILIQFSVIPLAIFTKRMNFGLFNVINLPTQLEFILSLLILDYIIYYQHKLFHTKAILWRLHKVHHTDLDIDTSTGIRFHPIEIIISMVIKFSVIFIFGISAIAFIIFEIILNSTSLFNHANININPKLDKFLRLILITPDMHRVHHSVIMRETNSNYGFSVPWWDYLSRTYTAQPQDGHQKMTIGLNQYRIPEKLGLISLLIMPFL